jgi:hypothetical protein
MKKLKWVVILFKTLYKIDKHKFIVSNKKKYTNGMYYKIVQKKGRIDFAERKSKECELLAKYDYRVSKLENPNKIFTVKM